MLTEVFVPIKNGEETAKAKLTDSIVSNLRSVWDGTYSFIVKNAKLYGVHKRTMQFALNGTTWKHLKPAKV